MPKSQDGGIATFGAQNTGILALDEDTDIITEEVIVTLGYFSGDVGSMDSSSFETGSSLAASNQKYYYNITDGAATPADQFTVSYGHYAGSGSLSGSQNLGASETEYKRWAEILLPDNEITGSFQIASAGSASPITGKDEEIYVLVAKRARMKDAINRKNWTMHLSGSIHGSAASASTLYLTDDSDSDPGTPTPYGVRFNIVSGSQGTVVSASTYRTYGWFYPNLGVWVMSGAQLSASLGGEAATSTAVVYQSGSQMGFDTYDTGTADSKNALRFASVLSAGKMQLRSERIDQNVMYFCRARAPWSNFTTNPTYWSGSRNEVANISMKNNPTVYITGVGLYNQAGIVVACAKLSKPLKKNFSSEATIKVKLTY
jgi:hypothetical protein